MTCNGMRLLRWLTFLFGLLLLTDVRGQGLQRLILPKAKQLTSGDVLSVIQDSEGFLWYATEGGGVCRDDGCKVDVFRSDADSPELIGSNKVGCLAEAGRYMLLGTFRGAYVIDREDFSVRRLEEVDETRVDDIIVAHDGHVWMTANRKIFEFSASLQLLNTYPSRWKGQDVYVSHFHEDPQHRLWVTQWSGGLLCHRPGTDGFQPAAWPLAVPPSDVADVVNDDDAIWVGTVGQGVVRYRPSDGTVELQPQMGDAICVDMQLTADGTGLWVTTLDSLLLLRIAEDGLRLERIDGVLPEGKLVLNRLSLDRDGRLLVAGSQPGSFVISNQPQRAWYDPRIHEGKNVWEYRDREGLTLTDADGHVHHFFGTTLMLPILVKNLTGDGIYCVDAQTLYHATADSLHPMTTLPQAPTALADDGYGTLWLATEKSLMHYSLKDHTLTTLPLSNGGDYSALAVTPDGTLWVGTVYGKVYRMEADSTLSQVDYLSNENGDGIRTLQVSTDGHLIIVSDRYVRLYDLGRHTLRQQSQGGESAYLVELSETHPDSLWHRPPAAHVVEVLPRWLTSWWMCLIYALIVVGIVLLLLHDLRLRRQRHLFLEQMKAQPFTADDVDDDAQEEPATKDGQSLSPAQPTADPWLQKAIAQVEANLSDEEYGVGQLSSDLCMSRMTFYRKIQEKTGQKPTEFIRTIRLRRAAHLLQQGQYTVGEVSDMTGFSTISYFSRCFRTMYGVPPTQFARCTTADALPSGTASANEASDVW